MRGGFVAGSRNNLLNRTQISNIITKKGKNMIVCIMRSGWIDRIFAPRQWLAREVAKK